VPDLPSIDTMDLIHSGKVVSQVLQAIAGWLEGMV
jgi:hypothetical protein